MELVAEISILKAFIPKMMWVKLTGIYLPNKNMDFLLVSEPTYLMS